jgi:hypothetical protein
MHTISPLITEPRFFGYPVTASDKARKWNSRYTILGYFTPEIIT